MFALRFQISGESHTIETVDIPEYTIRRAYFHIPLTNSWVLKEDPSIFLVIFPRLNPKKKEDIEMMRNKEIDAQVVIYNDKKKLQKLQREDSKYGWKEKSDKTVR